MINRNWLGEPADKNLFLPALRQLWREYQTEPKEKSLNDLVGFAKAALKFGDFLLRHMSRCAITSFFFGLYKHEQTSIFRE